MTEKRMWNKREKEVLISAVQKHPVLYDKGPDYRNKDMRYDAWSQVLQEVLIVRPDTSLYEIRSQWRVLQTCAARSERKRKIKEERGQVGCSPKTWLEESLSFCRSEQSRSQLISQDNSTSCVSPYSRDGFEYDENVEDGDENIIGYNGRYSSATIIPHIEETEMRHVNCDGNASVWLPQEGEAVNEALEEAAAAAENQNSRTQDIQDGLQMLLARELQRSSGVWAGTGTFVSDVLQRLSPQDALRAWKEINSVLEKYLPLMREDNL